MVQKFIQEPKANIWKSFQHVYHSSWLSHNDILLFLSCKYLFSTLLMYTILRNWDRSHLYRLVSQVSQRLVLLLKGHLNSREPKLLLILLKLSAYCPFSFAKAYLKVTYLSLWGPRFKTNSSHHISYP